MAKGPTFASFKFKKNEEVKIITIADKEIEVKQYLPAEDKNNLLEVTVQVADSATVVNTLALDDIFHVYIVFKYTNIVFTDKQKEDLFNLYDLLECNGVIDAVIKAIPEDEYNTLRDNLLSMVDAYSVYRNSARGVFEQIESLLPSSQDALKEKLDDIDLEKFQNVIDLANSTGMNNTLV